MKAAETRLHRLGISDIMIQQYETKPELFKLLLGILPDTLRRSGVVYNVLLDITPWNLTRNFIEPSIRARKAKRPETVFLENVTSRRFGHSHTQKYASIDFSSLNKSISTKLKKRKLKLNQLKLSCKLKRWICNNTKDIYCNCSVGGHQYNRQHIMLLASSYHERTSQMMVHFKLILQKIFDNMRKFWLSCVLMTRQLEY